MTEGEVNRDPDQYRETSDDAHAGINSRLVDTILRQREAIHPGDEPFGKNPVSTTVSEVGRSAMSSIFSTYSQGENRVTASILAVLRSLALSRIERLLAALMEHAEFELLRFENQPAKGGRSTPDAAIVSSCRILIETKIKKNAVKAAQLTQHLKHLSGKGELTQILLVITPDSSEPAAITKTGDERVIWTSFSALDQAIDEILDDKLEVVSEREAFLLRQLQSMLADERLIGLTQDVLVVAARSAWPEYQRFHAYICQPRRSFQAVDRMAFYSNQRIHPIVPRILEVHEDVMFQPGLHKGALGKLVEAMLQSPGLTKKKQGQNYKVMLLSAPDAPETVRLETAIVNDLVSASGRTAAFTQSHRYVRLEQLRRAETTTELLAESG